MIDKQLKRTIVAANSEAKLRQSLWSIFAVFVMIPTIVIIAGFILVPEVMADLVRLLFR